MWRLLEFKSVVNSHNEKLFQLVQHIILAVQLQARAQLLLQISPPATGGATGLQADLLEDRLVASCVA